jgi:hypothetical protein
MESKTLAEIAKKASVAKDDIVTVVELIERAIVTGGGTVVLSGGRPNAAVVRAVGGLMAEKRCKATMLPSIMENSAKIQEEIGGSSLKKKQGEVPKEKKHEKQSKATPPVKDEDVTEDVVVPKRKTRKKVHPPKTITDTVKTKSEAKRDRIEAVAKSNVVELRTDGEENGSRRPRYDGGIDRGLIPSSHASVYPEPGTVTRGDGSALIDFLSGQGVLCVSPTKKKLDEYDIGTNRNPGNDVVPLRAKFRGTSLAVYVFLAHDFGFCKYTVGELIDKADEWGLLQTAVSRILPYLRRDRYSALVEMGWVPVIDSNGRVGLSPNKSCKIEKGEVLY